MYWLATRHSSWRVPAPELFAVQPPLWAEFYTPMTWVSRFKFPNSPNFVHRDTLQNTIAFQPVGATRRMRMLHCRRHIRNTTRSRLAPAEESRELLPDARPRSRSFGVRSIEPSRRM